MLNIKNTLDGYLKNVEVIGNTIQDTNNLANIRSVGDKVEGQELYKIDVVSSGKNLLTNKLEDFIDETSYKKIAINLEVGKNYIMSTNCPLDNGSANLFIGEVLTNTNGCWNSVPRKVVGNGKVDIYIKKSFVSGTFEDFFNGKYYIQLEEGTQATPYEPYQEQKLEILSPVQLEKVGDVVDRIICKDGVWGVEKNIDTKSLENISHAGIYTGGNSLNTMCFTIQNALYPDWYKYKILSNHFIHKSYGVAEDVEGIYHGDTSATIYVRIKKSKLNGTTTKGFTDWARDNKLYVKYPSLQPQFIPLPHDQQVKLRTFAGQTNIAFLTEIPGQIKAQVPKSLGATVNTHTEQIADLHNSLERVKKLEETTVSTVETESSFTAVDATSNGYFEDVKLEGKTLVNVLRLNGNWFEQETTLQTDSTTAVGLSNYPKSQDLSLLKNNTVYTVVPFVDYTVVKKGTLYLQLNTEINGVQNGIFKIHEDMFNKPTLITTKELTNKNARSLFIGGINCEYKFKNVKILVLEGDHTNNPPEFFEGLMSVGQDVEEVSVESISNNLCAFSNLQYATVGTVKLGAHYKYTYEISSTPRNRVFGGIFKLPKSNHRKLYIKCDGYRFVHAFTDKDGVLLRDGGWKTTDTPILPLIGEEYLVIYVRREDGQIMSQEDIDFIEQNAVISYTNNFSDIKYKSHQTNKKPLLYYNPTTETWEKPVLREWDAIEKHSDGKYYYHKRSEEVVLNGSESWVFDSTAIHTAVDRYLIPFPKAQGLSRLFCDNFTILDTTNINVEGVLIGSDKSIYCNIAKSKLSTQDVAGFKAWLKANPTTVVYQLAQEEVYECTNIDLMTYSGETNYIINSGAISPKSLLKVHNNISNVVKILQEKVSLLENTFIAGLKSVLSGDMYSLATILYPEDFEQNDNTEQDIMVIPE